MAVPTGVRVAVRIRPLLAREAGQRQGVRSYPSQSKIVLTGLDRGQALRGESFPMDGSQEAVYEAVGAEIVRKAVEGYNACMLAYGHTGSGKTYTVMGSEFTRDLEPDDLSPLQCDAKPVKGTGTPRTSVREKVSASPLEKGPADSSFDMDVGFGSGLVPRTLEAIFNALSEESMRWMLSQKASRCPMPTFDVRSVQVAPLKIHNERIRDLLAPATPKEVEEVPCDDVQEALRLVSFGLQVRTTAATMLNDRSSRRLGKSSGLEPRLET
ncbi:KIN14D [Symbiodinium sp. KB8]|nr:KIN14D [Symbiodinium sp. KB8]